LEEGVSKKTGTRSKKPVAVVGDRGEARSKDEKEFDTGEKQSDNASRRIENATQFKRVS
jgi:hypothetical protein